MPRLRSIAGTSMPRAASNTSLPSIAIRPESGTSRPAMLRSRVVLPQPLGPSSVRNSPRCSSRLTPLRAWKLFGP